MPLRPELRGKQSVLNTSDDSRGSRSWRLADRWKNARPVVLDGWPALAVVIGVLVAFAIGYVCPRSRTGTAFAVAGVVLQWAGLAVVAVGLVRMRQRFERPSWFTRIWKSLRRPRDVTARLAADFGAVTATGTASAVGTVGPRTTEERLADLEQAVRTVREDLSTRAQALATSIGAVRDQVQSEATEREAAIRKVLAQIEDLSVGGLRLEAIGLWWLVVGVLFTSVPNELAIILGPF